MGVIIKMPKLVEAELERKYNVNQLKSLVEKYIPENKDFVIKKIKNEQHG